MTDGAGSQLIQPIQLPGLTLPGNIVLAPLAGWSDAAFRGICLEWGAFLAFTEMVSANAIARGNPKTERLLQRADTEHHLAVQIFAGDADTAGRAVRAVRRFSPALIDLNCGCSMLKILKNGAGAVLLKNPASLKSIVHSMSTEACCPVSVKIRSGWDDDTVNYLEVAQSAVEGGAAMITLHPRTATQKFGSTPDWRHIRRLKRSVPVPVLGSGNLFTVEDIRRMLSETGCDGAMVARGAMGNPFIFRDARRLLEHGDRACRTSIETRLSTALRQLAKTADNKGEPTACREMRKHFCAYTKGIPGSAALRRDLVRAGTLRDYRTIVEDFLASHGNHQT